MRLDSELIKILDDKLRITIQPGRYEYIQINMKNKKFAEYSRSKLSEVLITDQIVSLSFSIQENKPAREELMGTDLNFSTVDSTIVDRSAMEITAVKTFPIVEAARIQNDFSSRRRKLRKHVKNPQKRMRKLKQTGGRRRNRVRDAIWKISGCDNWGRNYDRDRLASLAISHRGLRPLRISVPRECAGLCAFKDGRISVHQKSA